MLLVEENHAGASTSMHTDNKMLYIEADRPRGCDGQGGSQAMEVADRSRTRGIIEMLTIVPDPPWIGGVKEAPEVGKERHRQTVGTVVGRAIEKVSAGRKGPIRT